MLPTLFRATISEIVQCLETSLVSTAVGPMGAQCGSVGVQRLRVWLKSTGAFPHPVLRVSDRLSIEKWGPVGLSSVQLIHFILIGRSKMWCRRPDVFRGKIPSKIPGMRQTLSSDGMHPQTLARHPD